MISDVEAYKVHEITDGIAGDAVDILLKLGIPPSLKGFVYIMDAVCAVYENPACAHSMVSGLYREIARKNGTTPSRVERCIRSAVGKIKNGAAADTPTGLDPAGDGITAKKLICTVAAYLADRQEPEKQ